MQKNLACAVSLCECALDGSWHYNAMYNLSMLSHKRADEVEKNVARAVSLY